MRERRRCDDGGRGENAPALVVEEKAVRHRLARFERSEKVIDPVGERHLEGDIALCLPVEPQLERESVAAEMRHHQALTTAAFVFGAEHEELRVALRLPRCKPVVVRVEAVLAKMMLSVEQLARAEANTRHPFG